MHEEACKQITQNSNLCISVPLKNEHRKYMSGNVQFLFLVTAMFIQPESNLVPSKAVMKKLAEHEP